MKRTWINRAFAALCIVVSIAVLGLAYVVPPARDALLAVALRLSVAARRRAGGGA